MGQITFRELVIPDYSAARKAYLSPHEAQDIGIPSLNLIVRLIGVPKVTDFGQYYCPMRQATVLQLYSDSWKPNTTLELIDYVQVKLPKATILSMEIAEWSFYSEVTESSSPTSGGRPGKSIINLSD